MKLIKFGLIICGILLFGIAKAQSATETRCVKTTALQIYENYKVVMSDLYSKNAYTEDNFMALFDSKALIYNDIIPSNTPAQLSPSEYFAKFKLNIKRIYPVFSDFKMGEPVSIENKWQIQCYFTRGTRFRTQKDMSYPEWSFNYILTIEMDEKYDENKKVYENAKIVNINVDNPLKTFFIIENKENIPLVSKSGETLNGWDKEYQSRIFPDDKWKIYDIKVPKSDNNENIFEYSKSKFSQNRKDTHFFQLTAQTLPKNIFGIGASRSLFALGNKTDDNTLLQTNYAISLSLFYGKQIAHKERSTMFFDVGLDFNCYSVDYFKINVDNNSFSYHNKFISVSIPVSLQYLYQLSQHSKKPTFLSFELGVFGQYTMDIKRDLSITDNELDGGIFGGIGFWTALNDSNMLKFNVSYKNGSSSLLNYDGFGIGISLVKTIGGK